MGKGTQRPAALPLPTLAPGPEQFCSLVLLASPDNFPNALEGEVPVNSKGHGIAVISLPFRELQPSALLQSLDLSPVDGGCPFYLLVL